MNLDAVQRTHLFPVRHHSPRATRVLERYLEALRPEAVLVEGPEDATPLIDVIVDPETRPPVAILGYRTDGPPMSTLWPFSEYSPEYAAIRWARANSKDARFIDLPVGKTLPFEDERETEDESGVDPSDPWDDFARGNGFRGFDELWEAHFEAPDHGQADFVRLVETFAGWSRSLYDRKRDRIRDAYMAQAVSTYLDEKQLDPERVVVVMGAAHVAAFVAGDVDESLLSTPMASVTSEVTLIPYSYPRLAEQLGYGAGNRAPMFYQKAHEAGCDFGRASLDALLALARDLRLRGFAVSIADTIEAYRLALRLAELRDKHQPGLDEVRESAVATLFRGDSGLVNQMLWPTTVGTKVGRVASRIGRNSLQEEFWHEVRTRRLPEHDAPESFSLQLHNDVETATSVFLHRLRVAEIPYATFLGTRASYGSSSGEAAGGLEALKRVRETWEAQWTPATDVALAEAISLGNSLLQVVTRRLDEQLGEATSAGSAAHILLEAVVTDASKTAATALERCDRLAASDDDLASLSRACQALSALVSFGSSRRISGGDEAIRRLCLKTFDRSVLRVEESCVVDDSGVHAVKAALRAIHDVATSQSLVDRDAWLEVASRVAESYAVHPVLSGLCTALLYITKSIDDDTMSTLLSQRLSDAANPDRAGGFLEGFLEVNALLLVRNRDLVGLLDQFLLSLPADAFRGGLPVLRRAFSSLGATERRYLLENVTSLRKIRSGTGELKQLMETSDEELKSIDDDVGRALDDLDDLL